MTRYWKPVFALAILLTWTGLASASIITPHDQHSWQLSWKEKNIWEVWHNNVPIYLDITFLEDGKFLVRFKPYHLDSICPDNSNSYAPAPEPSTLLLLGSGLMAMWGAGKGRLSGWRKE